MSGKEMLTALKQGREIVIVSNDENANSAIFYMSRNGVVYVFSRAFEIIKHGATGQDYNRLVDHFNNMIDEGANIYIRGWR